MWYNIHMAVSPDKPLTLRESRLVDALPLSSTQTEAGIKAGYAPASAAESACEALKKPNVIQAIADRKQAVAALVAAAQTHFAEHTVAIAKAMVERAEGKDRDSQRAAERILEQVGVLEKEPLAKANDPSQDVLAKLVMLMAKELAAPAQEQEKPSIEAEYREMIGPGHTDS
jgi:hypothetical protein